ncbi:MAG TPA: hypothetical protein EYH49_04840, partial [Aquifex aeolicus]|nr:hypothetical protein [Aquifex aeolicus]
MKARKYLLFLAVPLAVAVGMSFYASSLIISYMRDDLRVIGGERPPSIPVVRSLHAGESRELAEFLSYLSIKPPPPPPAYLPKKTGERPPAYRLQLVLLGEENYAIINDMLFREGDTLPSEERIVRITR